MKACGIVAEYNPFHNGHLWHMNQAREKSSADVMIVVMSGNFLQRGEPAIIDKWKRTAMALDAGADLVIELPFAFAVQPADFFAKGAIAILHAMNCSAISFGAEDGTDEEYEGAGSWYLENKANIDSRMQELKNEGAAYPAQMEKVMRALNPSFSFDLSSPNNQLGFAYARENATYKNQMKIHVVKRKGSSYHEAVLTEKDISSATAIRQSLFESDKEKAFEKISSFVPSSSMSILKEASFVNWEDYWPFLKYQLTVQPVEKLREIYQMSEGVEYRLKKIAKESESFQFFLSRAKTKRFTWTRLQRLSVYTLLQVADNQMKKDVEFLQAIRVLGFSRVGQSYLNKQKNKLAIPLVTNVNQKTKSLLQQDILAGNIYRLPAVDKIEMQDFKKSPIRSN